VSTGASRDRRCRQLIALGDADVIGGAEPNHDLTAIDADLRVSRAVDGLQRYPW